MGGEIDMTYQVADEFDFDAECSWMSERGFILCDDDDWLRWIPEYTYTDVEKKQIEDELYELYKDNQWSGVPHPIEWD